jgi:UDP-N-acetylmuramoylalanine--D-glutamate ligase
LAARGEEVVGADSGRPDVSGLDFEVHLRTNGVRLVRRAKTLVKSPGVPADAPIVLAARERGVKVIGELELAWYLLPNEFIAVTGTNGKTTTVELIGHIHREAGLPVAVAGNVGTALSALTGKLGEGDVVVCEASSFQLEDTAAFAPDAAALLNITADHLDRHGTFGAYVDAKLQIFRRQLESDIAVVPSDLGVGVLGGSARRVRFGEAPHADLAERDGELWWQGQPLLADQEIRLRGPHNRLNAMAAAALTLARGVDPDAVRAGLRSFAGVAHRLEEVAERRGVLYVNDSKATNVASTLVALRSFERGSVHLILGGQGKQQEFEALRVAVALRCAAVYLIGEDGSRIGAALAGATATHECGELERALELASQQASAGQVVLLSPACASFDQFADFEARGDRFRELVEALD